MPSIRTDNLGELFPNVLGNILGQNTDFGGTLGNFFSQGVSAATNTIGKNILKGQGLVEGLSQDVGQSLAGTGVGLAAQGIGKGISSLGGDSMLSRGLGQATATGLGTIGGQAVGNLFKGKNAFQGIKDMTTAIKVGRTAKAGSDAAKLAGAAKFNLAGLAGQVVGSGLQAAFGPSKEYGGKYGGITQTMDAIYDIGQGVVGTLGPVGMGVAGLMAMNKGLSNIFGSTSGMTTQDAILGSAFMPAPVKWLNMAGAKTTSTFNNQSWQNSQKANSFMGNAFGNLNDKFDQAREEAGKTYGTFSRGAYNDAQNNIDFANNAWGKILAMADQNELQKIRSQYMSSINNQRYAQQIMGGFNPIARGKQGMKIFNNATNHNIGMRLLSAAALIDNKAMILCNAHD